MVNMPGKRYTPLGRAQAIKEILHIRKLAKEGRLGQHTIKEGWKTVVQSLRDSELIAKVMGSHHKSGPES